MTPERLEKVDKVLGDRQSDLTVLAEQLHKPRNFSALIRSCDAVGIPEVQAVPNEEGLKRHWRTSQGAEKWVRVRKHETVDAACGWLKSKGFNLVAAHLSDQAVDFREVDYTQPTALVVGTELFGVSEAALEHIDTQIQIPMLGMTQSLNVSVACAVVLYEAQRQRQLKGLYGERAMQGEIQQVTRFEWLHPRLAHYCRERGFAYPEINEDGDVIGHVPRSMKPKTRKKTD